ncbi:1-acylglycerol-3-phosphate O-acyltransferase [Thiolapillus sp.]
MNSADKAEMDERRLLGIISTLAQELAFRSQRIIPVEIDSALERDLGFDSLSRVELMLRIEREFGVGLPERILSTAETPHDLLQAIQAASGRASLEKREQVPLPAVTENPAGVPYKAETLNKMLQWHVQEHAERTHIYLYEESEEPEQISYLELLRGAEEIAAGLQQQGLSRGDTVAIMLPTSRDYLFSFFGILLAGAVPVPIYPPVRPSQLEDHLRRHGRILDNARSRLLITVPEARMVAGLLRAQVNSLKTVVTPAQLREAGAGFLPVQVQPDDTAFLQYTSGSTGQPKGVVLTHANLLANIRAMGEAIKPVPSDVFVSWLPLYHDMGLIGAWLGSLYYAIPLVLMSPLGFLSCPSRWLWRIHHHRGTLSAAPNFAYELCLSKIAEEDIQGLDLSSWRMAFNGAEPVSPNTVRNFAGRFSRYGFAKTSMAPVYGLAEAAVGLAFPPPGREVIIDRVQRDALLSRGEALPAVADERDVQEIVACGQPLHGYQIRIVDAAGQELPDRRVGVVEFQGPSATSGYFHNAQATRELFRHGWLNTGDLGYIADGDLYLTSRVKDLIIRGGRNLYPYETEEAVGDIPGIRKGCVVLFGVRDKELGTERLILVAETRERDKQVLADLQSKAMQTATDVLGMPPDEVILAPPHTVLKTSSGKLRRSVVQELYEKGSLGHVPKSVGWQLVRLALASVGPRWRHLRRRFWDLAWAAWAHAVFWMLSSLTWLMVVLLPGKRRRWRVIRGASRLLLRLLGIPLKVVGQENLPAEHAYVVVANHASYMDGVVLAAALPVDLVFVAKSELRQQPLPRIFLNKIGVLFVERFRPERSVADIKRSKEAMKAGQPLLYFPEGTLSRAPGLLPFRMGAFVIAAEAGVPVVPVVIRGTRSVLRGSSWFPHRAALSVSVLPAVQPESTGWEAAIELRDAARASMLLHLGEPDLTMGGTL